MPLSGCAAAVRAIAAATWSAGIGWMRASGTRTSLPVVRDSVIASANSANWVARTIE